MPPVNTVKVWYINGDAEVYDSYHSGLTEAPYRLYIYTNPQRTEVLYINFDHIQAYSIIQGD